MPASSLPDFSNDHIDRSSELDRRLTLTQRRALGSIAVYTGLLATAVLLNAIATSPALRAFALGLTAPGAGFLPWAGAPAGASFAIASLATALALFGVALILRFATGNVVLPPVVWLGSAISAGVVAPPAEAFSGQLSAFVFASGAVAALVTAGFAIRRSSRSPVAASGQALPVPKHTEPHGELSISDLRLLRLLLDRALQPVERFDGFEWRDQFQTAAIRYQLNFMSYALSLVQARHTPAFTGYLAEAQRRLLRKQEDHRVWRYWALESAWGHLSHAADPMPRGNIMYSGFVAAQMAYAVSAGSIGREDAVVNLHRPSNAVYHYTLDDIAGLLTGQYRTAPWGLLACEPHWVYPLCNFISATALRAVDARTGSDHWAAIAPRFRAGLEREFTTADGRLVPFRSTLTGFALPGAGGIVMQAFPCLFLPTLYPDLAEIHWDRVRHRLARQSWKRAFWPIDVGNYGFSRASNVAACAAAATEVGDSHLAGELLAFLDQQCPMTLQDGVSHRPRASLWAHAVELMARVGAQSALCRLTNRPRRPGPHIERADYPAVLVAAAHSDGDSLSLVLYPSSDSYAGSIEVAGLRPGRHYRCEGAGADYCRADEMGRATIGVALADRSALTVTPVI